MQVTSCTVYVTALKACLSRQVHTVMLLSMSNKKVSHSRDPNRAASEKTALALAQPLILAVSYQKIFENTALTTETTEARHTLQNG